jgi:serine/threonine protein kinase
LFFDLLFLFIQGKKLQQLVPKLGKPGLDLLEKFLQYDPAKRISAKDAMRHPVNKQYIIIIITMNFQT